MKTKFLLPVLALVFATGMSFATANLNADPDNDYIFRNGWEELPEVECNPENDVCLAYSESEDQTYPIYDSMSFSDLKEGDGTVEIEVP